MADLDQDLIAAHDAQDTSRLIDLYRQAADKAEQAGDIDAACFYLTHAFVYALEAGSAEAPVLNKRLVRHGRAEPITEK